MILSFNTISDISFFETLIIGLVSLNFYLKQLIPKKNLSASTVVPSSTFGVIVHRFFLIVLSTKIEIITKKKVTKKKGNNSNTNI
jgi:hypothetical protein